jgi:arsenical pump membrane protein
MFLSLAFFPTITIGKIKLQTFYFGPLLGAILILAFQKISFPYLYEQLTATGGINPLEILVLFVSMSILSLSLDEAGFFSYLAHKVASKAGKNQMLLFTFLYLLASVLTIFTSNDIVILTFTPFVIFFTHEAKVDAKPYLVSEFVAANSWSMLLLIGNPTNIYLGVSFSIDFFAYFSKMWLATLLAGVSSFLLMLLFFHRSLKKPLESSNQVTPLKDPLLAIISLIVLGATIVLLAISNFISLPMWIIALSGACLILLLEIIMAIIRKNPNSLLGVIKRPPYAVIPFILSMFVLVLALASSGLTSSLASYLSNINPYLGFGLGSYLASNLFNNIPMSVLFTELISQAPTYNSLFVYLSIISSNIGAYLTPVGALAGFMWTGIIKEHKEKFPIRDFFKYLSPISLVSLGFAFLGLFLVY